MEEIKIKKFDISEVNEITLLSVEEAEKHPEAHKHNLIQYVDQSMNGAGGYNSVGACWTAWNCGDNGNYALFEPILYEDYKGALEARLDEWGISLYHHDGSEKSIYELLYDIVSEIESLIQRKNK